jgi:hypothetical protein
MYVICVTNSSWSTVLVQKLIVAQAVKKIISPPSMETDFSSPPSQEPE